MMTQMDTCLLIVLHRFNRYESLSHSLLVASLVKKVQIKATSETFWYSSDSTRQGLSNEYQYDRDWLVCKHFAPWTNEASA